MNFGGGETTCVWVRVGLGARVCRCVYVHTCVLTGHFWRVRSCPGLWMVFTVLNKKLSSTAGGNPRQFSLCCNFLSGVLTLNHGCIREHVSKCQSYKSILFSVSSLRCSIFLGNRGEKWFSPELGLELALSFNPGFLLRS